MADFMLCIDGMEETNLPLPVLPESHLLAYGTVQTAPNGGIIDSLGCILRLLGIQEQEMPQGRAALEALAVGLSVPIEDAFFRCTVCAIDEYGCIYPAQNAEPIMQQFVKTMPLSKGWHLHALSGYRCLLQIENGASQLQGLCTKPPHQFFSQPLTGVLPCGGKLADALTAFTIKSTKWNAGYVLLPWGQSTARPLPSFMQRMGVSGAMVCKTEIVQGIANALQMECPHIIGTTADVDTDLGAKLQAARQLAATYPFVMIHVNGCDEAGHRRDILQKEQFRNRILENLLLPLLQGLQDKERILLCSDHRTDSITGAHEAGPVHFWMYGAAPQEKICHFAFQNADAPLRLLLDRKDIETWQKQS